MNRTLVIWILLLQVPAAALLRSPATSSTSPPYSTELLTPGQVLARLRGHAQAAPRQQHGLPLPKHGDHLQRQRPKGGFITIARTQDTDLARLRLHNSIVEGRIIKVCARLAEGKGEADHPAAAPEDDVSAVQVRARRRRGCVRTGGDQERQFKILGSGK